MKTIAIDISDKDLIIAELRQRFGSIGIRSLIHEPIDVDLMSDGRILDIPQLTKKLQGVLEEHVPHILKGGGAYMSLPESKVFTHVFTFPRELRENEVEDAIAIQFADYFPYEIDTAAYDWKVVQESDQTQMILVGACEKQYVEQLTALTSALGILLLGVDLESASTARALLPQAKDLDSYMVVDLGARVASLSIFDEQGLQSTLVLDGCGDKITNAISAKTGLSWEESEELKKKIDLNDRQSDELDLCVVVEDQLTPVVEEIKRTIRFYEGSRKKQVKEVFLSGGTSRLTGLYSYIASRIDRPVQCGDVTTHIKSADAVEEKGMPIRYANSIGLCLGTLDKKHHKTRYNFLRYVDTPSST